MNNLGIVASSISGSKTSTSSFESIATTTVGSGGSASITFSSIPSTYSALQIRILSQTNRATTPIDSLYFQFNADTGNNYWYHNFYTNGTTISAGSSGAAVARIIPVINGTAGSVAGTNVFGVGIVDVQDYASTSKYKVLRAFQGSDLNGAVAATYGNMGIGSGMWNSTSAITSITVAMVQGTLFSQYSTFALYGIK